MSDLGKGAPDIAVGSNGFNLFFEIKDGPKGKFTQSEIDFSNKWNGHYTVVRSVEDVDIFVLKFKNNLKFVRQMLS